MRSPALKPFSHAFGSCLSTTLSVQPLGATVLSQVETVTTASPASRFMPVHSAPPSEAPLFARSAAASALPARRVRSWSFRTPPLAGAAPRG